MKKIIFFILGKLEVSKYEYSEYIDYYGSDTIKARALKIKYLFFDIILNIILIFVRVK